MASRVQGPNASEGLFTPTAQRLPERPAHLTFLTSRFSMHERLAQTTQTHSHTERHTDRHRQTQTSSYAVRLSVSLYSLPIPKCALVLRRPHVTRMAENVDTLEKRPQQERVDLRCVLGEELHQPS